MPVAYHQLHPVNAGAPGYGIAIELARQVIAQFSAVRGASVGIGPGSCCAAVAVNPSLSHAAVRELVGFDPTYGGAASKVAMYGGGAKPFGVIFGNSQLAAGGLDMHATGGHAERVALNAVGNTGATLYLPGNRATLFVELTPCGPCQTWLGNLAQFQGMGAPTLDVWWRWEYPDWNTAQPLGGVEAVGGLNAMKTFHGLECGAELTRVNTDWA